MQLQLYECKKLFTHLVCLVMVIGCFYVAVIFIPINNLHMLGYTRIWVESLILTMYNVGEV